jgi:hypothetical protein
MRHVALLLVAACADSPATVTRHQLLATSCGPGTHDVNGECVLDRYEVRTARQLGADGVTKNKVVAFGWQPDGSPALDDVVLSLDRSDGGMLTRTNLKLEQLGASTYFIGCDETKPSCVKGPLQIRVALASDPTTIVGKLAVELVEPIKVNPARQCLGGGSRLKLEGNDAMLSGTVDLSQATWEFPKGSYSSQIFMTVTAPSSPETWTLEFNTTRVPGVLSPGKLYEEIGRAELDYRDQAPDLPAMYIHRSGVECASITGRFHVVDYAMEYPGPKTSRATLYFEQHCNGDTSTVLRGCVHYQ